MSIKNTDVIENHIQNGVQHVNSDESNNKIAKLPTKTLKSQRQKILETSSITREIQKPNKGRNSKRNEELIKILCFPKTSMFLQGLSNLFRILTHAFSARVTVITHIAFDLLYIHALLSIKTSTSFLKGSIRVKQI